MGAASLLLRQGHPRVCPACGARFEPFMRGLVYRPLSLWQWLRCGFRRPRPWRQWCLICDTCKEIVGYEEPGMGFETDPRFSRQGELR